LKSFVSCWLPVLAWAAFILLVSSIPEPLDTAPSELSRAIQGYRILGVEGVALVSFVIHFSLYAVLGFLAGRAVVDAGPLTPGAFLLALALCAAFGLLDELYQVGVPGRGLDGVDLLADALGALVGLSIFAVRHRALEESS
jgi:VanZ family protein